MKASEKAAVRRVLRLVDGYLSTRDQDELVAWDGGLMTWRELRRHVKAALKLIPPKHRITLTRSVNK